MVKNSHQIESIKKIMQEAGQHLISQKESKDFEHVDVKKGKEIVSKIDVEIEKKIRDEVGKVLPNHKFWGEELGKDHGIIEKEDYLIVDPIDGTKNYLSGVPLYATQIACVERGSLMWGIIVIPELNETFLGIKDQGAYLNGEKISGSKQTDLGMANQCFGLGHDANNIIELPKLLTKYLAEPRSYGSAGVHFSFAACGRIDIYIAAEAGFYDVAPGIIICKEAGLGIYDFKGNECRTETELPSEMIVTSRSLIKDYKKS